MHKFRFFSVLLFVSLLFVLLPATAKAIWDVPVGPGESFRWLFVTSQGRDATSTNIGDYNWFVNNVADTANTPITGVVGKSSIADIDWRAIASTPTTDAIDNIGVSPAGIYTPWMNLVANGTADLFDGDILSPIIFDERGVQSFIYDVWTGTDHHGSRYQTRELGTEGPVYGNVLYTNAFWVEVPYADKWPGDNFSLYAISEELSAVPVPGALILAATGLLSVRLGLKRLRRKHQE